MIMVWVCDSLSAQNKEGHFSLKYRCQKHEHILGAEASCRQSNLRCHANTFFGRQKKKKSVLAAKMNETLDETFHDTSMAFLLSKHRMIFKNGALKKCISVVLFAVQMMFCVTT